MIMMFFDPFPRLAFAAVLATGPSALALDVDPTGEGIPPVRMVGQESRTGGPDFYTYDWPVDPGPWPTVSTEGLLRFPMVAHGAGYGPGEFTDIAEWWKVSDFDLVHYQASVQYGMTGRDVAQRNIEFIMNHAAETGRKVIAHVGHTAEMLGHEALIEHINAIKDHPGLWGYEVADEPGTSEPRLIWTSHAFRIIRNLDPEHPILSNDLGNKKEPTLLPYVRPDTPDFWSWDCYPIQAGNGTALETHYTRQIAAICRELDITPAYILGNYAPVEAPYAPLPWFPRVQEGVQSVAHLGKGGFSTAGQIRSQVYQGVIAGMKMLLWWPWGEWVDLRFDRPDLRKATYQVNREVHALTGPIFSTLDVPVSFEVPAGDYTRPEGIVGMAKLFHDELFIFAANIAERNVPLGQRTVDGGVGLADVKIVLDGIPAAYRRYMHDEAEVLFEIAGHNDHGVPEYVKARQDEWRRVPVQATDCNGQPASRFQPVRGSVWGPEWTGEEPAPRPARGTGWSLWEGEKASMSITDSFGPYAVHIYRIGLRCPAVEEANGTDAELE